MDLNLFKIKDQVKKHTGFDGNRQNAGITTCTKIKNGC